MFRFLINRAIFVYQFKQKLCKMKTLLSHFAFQFAGHGHYKVTYTSPKTGKTWTVKTSNMPLIDATKNSEAPKRKDLNQLKSVCKA